MAAQNAETPLAGGASGNAVAPGRRANSIRPAMTASTPGPFARYVAGRFADPDDIVTEFMPELADAALSIGGLLPSTPLVLDGGKHYLRNTSNKVDRKQFYIGRFERSADGTIWPCITFASFRAGIPRAYFSPRNLVWEQFRSGREEARPQSDAWRADYARRAAERMEKQAQLEADQAAQIATANQAAADFAAGLWLTSKDCARHFYLEAKGVRSHGLRVARATEKGQLWKIANSRWETTIAARAGDLLIPMFDIDGKLWGLQRIEALPTEGKHARWFLAGSRKRGLFYRIGGEGPAWLAEGYATAATVHEATGMPVYVAFDAYNMPAVARQLVGTIVAVAADNDRNGAGTIAAKTTALPYFAPPTVGHDWNDHARDFGLDSVRELLGAVNAA